MDVKAVTQLLLSLSCAGLVACTSESSNLTASESDSQGPIAATAENSQSQNCILVESGFGPQGSVEVRAEEVVSGLEVPWGIGFLPNGDILVTERLGRLRLVRDGQLQPEPVATIATSASGEGGLLDLELHPDFASNRQFYLYYTSDKSGAPVNRVERWTLAQDGRRASPDTVILDDIPAARFHNGGRLRFGPDGMLYIGTGDARDPDSSQDRNSLAGKILRLTPEGEIPADNPFPDNPVFVTGIRNTQGWDWPEESTLWVSDHGPSGELGRTGHDEVSAATAGDNLGWPTIYRCQSQAGLVTPAITWRNALPPGGAAIYTGDAIPEWQGSLIVGALGAELLTRVELDPDSGQVQRHEVYFQNELGRLRDVMMGPDGELYVTTSNCDGRGNCPPEKDKILRITR